MLRGLIVVTAIAGCTTGSTSAPRSHDPPAAAVAAFASPAGEWRGTSLCTVKPSACHDETVVYHVSGHVSGAADPDSFVLVANKLVDGREEEMGTLSCHLDRDRRTLTCPFDKGTFNYVLDGDHMHGTLDLPDGQRFRQIETERAR
jgi:hypothetical protein